MSDAWLRRMTSCGRCLHGHHDECYGYPEGNGFTSKEAREHLSCECANRGHPVLDTCYIFSYGDFRSHRCGRPAKGVTRSNISGRREDNPEVPACGIHIAAYRRVLKNNERHRLESEARQAAYRKQRETAQASEMWAQKLRDEFGIEADALQRSSSKIRVEVSPEQLYGQLDEAARLLDQFVEEHPLQGGR